mgnify:CR=1 FL=1
MRSVFPIILAAISDPDDRDFMENLYTNYHRLMYSEICKIIGETSTAEDLLQESLIKLSDKIPLLRTLEGPRKINYIITTVRNMSINHLRKQNVINICSLDDERNNIANTVSDGTNIEENIILFYEQRNFERVWGQLDETSQTLLEGKYIFEKNDAELGEIIGIKPASVRMMLTRARRKALELMTEDHSLL